uniref:Uncharacterized protein n=1 Tax=Octopus bimaculoides TaxID=37653 RepID=A0A0L8GD22_OCTBM
MNDKQPKQTYIRYVFCQIVDRLRFIGVKGHILTNCTLSVLTLVYDIDFQVF